MKKKHLRNHKHYRLFLLLLLLVIVIPNSEASPGPTPNGYRVQIFANKSKVEAIKVKSDYEAKYGSEKVKLYIEFIDGWYKVRLGDFKTKEEAQYLCQKVKQLGYTDAWIVFTVIEFDEND
ncbi:MAG: SPOR domain-containing protein [Bacteroidales bacterium]|nr:SPOR domain-containing protein [Bacteroidales bacterium]